MIGIDISDHSIKIVQLLGSDEKKLTAHCWRPVSPGVLERGVIVKPDVISKQLAQALSECKIRNVHDDPVVVSIPETQSFLRVTEVPHMADDEVTEAVRWDVKQHIPFGLENVYIDWQHLNAVGHDTTKNQQEVLVGAAQKKVVDPLWDVVQSLDLDVAAFELESQAITRVLVSSELRSKQGVLIVDVGSVATNVIIHDHGAMRFTASLQKGASHMMSGTLAPDEMQLLDGPPHPFDEIDTASIQARLQPAEEELVVEIKGIVEFYNGIDTQHQVREILLTGGGANLPGLDHAFLKYFDNVHMQRGNPWVNILPAGVGSKSPLDLHESVHFTTALGLALREVVV